MVVVLVGWLLVVVVVAVVPLLLRLSFGWFLILHSF